VKKPKLLLLDDVFSNVDSSTELKIMNYIKTKLINTTIVLSSNRLSVLTYCSDIFVFKSGHLIQTGSHSNLISIEGEYKKLFSNQLRSE
jgi:ATP-binding cassette subfamily B protein